MIPIKAGCSLEDELEVTVAGSFSIFTADTPAAAMDDEEDKEEGGKEVDPDDRAAAAVVSRALMRAWIPKNSSCSTLVRMRVISRSGRNRKRRWNRGKCRMSTPIPKIIQTMGRGSRDGQIMSKRIKSRNSLF
jgi:hypothetical protein